ncbi:hypothetical protein [Streptomyces sp. 2A115]|uniref:hypothetical protein n=1 Tax=Streptomyces sp. 2A115 TaxID=3457439 RepID=UPI003FD6886A
MDIFSTGERAEKTADVAQERDDEAAVFDPTVTEDWRRRSPSMYVLDRELNPSEREELEAAQGTDVLEEIGAKPVRDSCAEGCGLVQYYMRLSSQKSESFINVTDFKVRSKECKKDPHVTIFQPVQGEQSVPTPLRVDLREDDPVFTVEDPENGGSVPYSQVGGEVLGKSAKPSTFKLDVISDRFCTWTLDVLYLSDGAKEMKSEPISKELRAAPAPSDADEIWVQVLGSDQSGWYRKK